MTDVTAPDSPAAPAQGTGEAETKGDPTPQLELDCRGLNCPLPILKTKKAIQGLEVGQIVKMIATDPGSIPDVAAFSRRTGHEVVQQSEGGGEYTFWIRKR